MIEPAEISVVLGDKLLALGGPNVSRHLDELIDFPPAVSNYGEWCFRTFLELVNYLRAIGDSRTIVWVIPVSVSDGLKVNDSPKISDVTVEFLPSTVYLLSKNDIFSDCAEEFRYRILLPTQDRRIGAIYRSWRDVVGAEHGWEFNNDIYLWSIALDAPTSPVR